MKKKKNIKGIKKEKKGCFGDRFCEFITKSAFKILKLIITLIIGALFGVYSIIDVLFDIIINFVKKLPKIAKMGLFYGVIGLVIFLIINPRTIEKYIGYETIKEYEVTKYVKIDDKTCKMDKYSCMIYLVAKEYGLTEEQSFMTVAISIHETGEYTSEAFKNKNNVGGVFKNGQLASYETLEQGINDFISNLKKNYFEQGLDTIEKIQKKYCPVGASNDSKGVNVYWLPMVTKYYNELIENYMEV